MDQVTVCLTDSKGTLKLVVSRQTAEMIKNDNTYATYLMEQVRAATQNQASTGNLQMNPPLSKGQLLRDQCSTPVPMPVSITPSPVAGTQPSTVSTSVQSVQTFMQHPNQVAQVQPSKIPGQNESVPPLTQCITPVKTKTYPKGLQCSSPSNESECHGPPTEFTHRTTLLLLELTREHQHLYHRNKNVFYKKLEQEFCRREYKLTTEKIRKKLGNMLTTYKRAKDRSTQTGEGKITWEYYTVMDELFGRTAVGSAPPGTTISTPLFPKEAHPSAAQSSSAETEEQPGPSSAIQVRQASGSRRSKTVQLPSFFQSYEAHAERRTTALESLTRPELANWRRLKEKRRRGFEKQVITCMGQILIQLNELGKQQEKLISLLEGHSK